MAIVMINDDYAERHTLNDLQNKLGILDSNHGIVYEAVQGTPLQDLLENFIELADYDLYFNYTNRLLLSRYSDNIDVDNITLVKKAVYYSLASNEYNLKTLINSVNLDYNPIENYAIHETTEREETLSSTRNYGESTATITQELGKGKVIDTTADDGMKEVTTSKIGSQSDSTTKNIGARSQSTNNENTTSPYNSADYVPNSKNVGSVSDQAATDTENITKGARDDSSTTETDPHTVTQTTETDAKTDKETKVRSPRQDTIADTNKDKKSRDLTGRYGFITTQSMVEAERNLANLNITNYISTIVVSTICEGVLYDC